MDIPRGKVTDTPPGSSVPSRVRPDYQPGRVFSLQTYYIFKSEGLAMPASGNIKAYQGRGQYRCFVHTTGGLFSPQIPFVP